MTNLYNTLFSAAGDVLKELQPNTWDTVGLDVMKSYVQRWQLTEKMETESLTIQDVWRDAILDEKLINSARYKAYVKSGGMYKPDVMAPEAEIAGTEQASDFVMSGHVFGENISLQTQHGLVRTNTERILSFTKFQQDVLRDTLTVYPSSLKKKHEKNVIEWVARLVKYEKAEDDETLPRNILADKLAIFLSQAITEKGRQERGIEKGAPVRMDGSYYFQLDALLAFVQEKDKEYRWKKSEIKLYLQDIYGSKLKFREKIFRRYHCVSITIPDPNETPAQAQIFDDSGSRQDDPAPRRRDAGAEAGQIPAVTPDPLVLKSDGGGGEDTPTQSNGTFVPGRLASVVE